MTVGRVLVTGATGLIGRQVVAPLRAAGYEVVALSRSGQGGIACDLLDWQALDRVVAEVRADHLLHLAWHDGEGRWTSPLNLDWVAATLRLLRAFATAGGRRAVLVGSCAEYDWAEPVLSESSALKPATLYGSAKAATGMVALAGAGAMGLSLAWARVFFCYGPGEPKGRLLGDLISGLSQGLRVPCTDGLQERDFLHTADVGAALAAVLASEVQGAVNIGSGVATPVRQLILTVAARMGRPELVELGARPRPADDPARIVADIARLRGEVGFRPRHDIASGVDAVLAGLKGAA